MPRNDFRLRRPLGFGLDDHGLDFPNLEAADLGAFDAILTTTVEFVRRKENLCRYAFEVTDKAGRILLDVPFAEFPDRGQRPRRDARA